MYHYLQFKTGYTEERSNETYLGLSKEDFNNDPYLRYAASQNDVMNSHQHQYSAQYGLKADRFSFKMVGYYNKFHRNWYKLAKLNYGDETLSLGKILGDTEEYAEPYKVLKGEMDAEGALNIKANNRNYQSYGVQPVFGLQIGSTGLLRHQIELSLRYHYDEIDRFEKVDLYDMIGGTNVLAEARDFGTASNRIQSATAFSSYLRYQLQVGKKLIVTPGIRYEGILLRRKDYGKSDTERTGSDLSERERGAAVWIPGVGVNYFVSPLVKTFFGVHKGFSPPTDDAWFQARGERKLRARCSYYFLRW